MCSEGEMAHKRTHYDDDGDDDDNDDDDDDDDDDDCTLSHLESLYICCFRNDRYLYTL